MVMRWPSSNPNPFEAPTEGSVVAFMLLPPGPTGLDSKVAADASRLQAYIVPSLLTGCRTEEARAGLGSREPGWRPDAQPPVPPDIARHARPAAPASGAATPANPVMDTGLYPAMS